MKRAEHTRGRSGNPIEERGVFWLAENRQLGEASGQLTINSNGTSSVKLDIIGNTLTKEKIDLSKNHKFTGKLENSTFVQLYDSSILAFDSVRRDEVIIEFICHYACISSSELENDVPRLSSISFDLGKTTGWFQATKSNQKSKAIESNFGSISIEPISPYSEGELEFFSTITVTPRENFKIHGIRDFQRCFENFIYLFVDHLPRLSWPKVKFSNLDGSTTIIFTAESPKQEDDYFFANAWFHFPEVEEKIGLYFENWIQFTSDNRSPVGLFFAAHRGADLFTEYNFLMLVTAAEAYHTEATKDAPMSPRKENLIGEILDREKNHLNSADRKWLKSALERSNRVAIQERITDILQELPFKISPDRIDRFAEACRKKRNAIAHHGGLDKNIEPEEFTDRAWDFIFALDIILHVTFLKKIGVSDDLIFNSIRRGRIGLKVKYALEVSNLLDEQGENDWVHLSKRTQ